MDEGAQTAGDRLSKLERRITRLTWLTIAQTVLLAFAVVVYVISQAGSIMFWLTAILIVGGAAWMMRDKSPRWLKALGRWGKKLMTVQAEHTAVVTKTAPEQMSDSTRMAG